jgi:hypothetical protein
MIPGVCRWALCEGRDAGMEGRMKSAALLLLLPVSAAAQPGAPEAAAREYVGQMQVAIEARSFCIPASTRNAELVRNMRTTEAAMGLVFSARVRDWVWATWARQMVAELRLQAARAPAPTEPCSALLERFEVIARTTANSLQTMMPQPDSATRDQH